jgi:hypothetical protein
MNAIQNNSKPNQLKSQWEVFKHGFDFENRVREAASLACISHAYKVKLAETAGHAARERHCAQFYRLYL